MQDAPTYQVIRRGQNVGTYSVLGIDHQYWDGAFRGNGSQECMAFIDECRAVNPTAAFGNSKLGVPVTLEREGSETVAAIVFSFSADFDMALRWYYAPEAIEWIGNNN